MAYEDDAAFNAMNDSTKTTADNVMYDAKSDYEDNWSNWEVETEEDMKSLDKIMGGVTKSTGLTADEIFKGYGGKDQNPKLTDYFTKGREGWEGVQSRDEHLSGSGITSEQRKKGRVESQGYFDEQYLKKATEKYKDRSRSTSDKSTNKVWNEGEGKYDFTQKPGYSDLSTTYASYKGRTPEVTKLIEKGHGIGDFSIGGRGTYKSTNQYGR